MSLQLPKYEGTNPDALTRRSKLGWYLGVNQELAVIGVAGAEALSTSVHKADAEIRFQELVEAQYGDDYADRLETFKEYVHHESFANALNDETVQIIDGFCEERLEYDPYLEVDDDDGESFCARFDAISFFAEVASYSATETIRDVAVAV